MARLYPIVLLAFALCGCVTSSPDGSPQVQSPSQARRADLANAIASPLRDANLIRSKIPSVLLAALDDPYARPRFIDCGWIVDEVLPLNGALGLDMKEPNLDLHTLEEHGAEAALNAVANASSGVLPMRSWVRFLSGAQQHDKLVTTAIAAGQIRRAYLKGLGEARGCPPPARPYQH